MDNITILNGVRDRGKNGNVIRVATAATVSAADIQINNSLDILLKSMTIKDILHNKKEVSFNLQKLSKVFVKGFIYRMIQGLYVFTKYQRIKRKQADIFFYAPQLSKADIDGLYSILYYSNLSLYLFLTS